MRVSFSSEQPTKRSYGLEILSHASGDVDLERIRTAGALLFNHNQNQVVGRVDRAWVENGRGYADVTFDEDEFSDTIYQKVRRGSLRGVSFFYDWDRTRSEFLRNGEMSADGRFTGPVVVRHGWFPLELSIVAVPADATVGVGRSFDFNDTDADAAEVAMHTENEEQEDNESMMDSEKLPTSAANEESKAPEPKTAEADEKRSVETASQDVPGTVPEGTPDADMMRVMTIVELCDGTGVSAADCIRQNMSLGDVRSLIVNDQLANHGPIHAGSVDITDEGDKMRSAMTEAILVRAQVKPHTEMDPAASEYLRMSTRDMFIRAYTAEGMPERKVRSMRDDDLIRMFAAQADNVRASHFNATALFPAILDDAADKAIAAGYDEYPFQYEQVVTKASVKDFKETRNLWRFGHLSRQFDRVPEGGEIPADNFGMEKLPTIQVKTFGKQWSLTRETIINDDIHLVAQSAVEFARMWKETLNDMVFSVLVGNDVIYDGLPLFCAQHRNLLAQGTTVTGDAYDDMTMMLSEQIDGDGNPIAFNPGMLVLPNGMQGAMTILFESPTINTADNTQAANPFYHANARPLYDTTLTKLAGADNPVPWFLFAAGPSPIILAFLNGEERLHRRIMETPGRLGVIYDYYADAGTTVVDYRQIVRNDGTVRKMHIGPATV